MANLIPSFASGSNLAISITDGVTPVILAYATNLSFTDDMTHAPVGGIGAYGYDAIEPTQYAVRGSFTITQYNLASIPNVTVTDPTDSSKKLVQVGDAPSRVNKAAGNSFLRTQYFSPLTLLLQKTFDIVVYERTGTDNKTINDKNTTGDLTQTFLISDCRLTSYSFTFTPGQIVGETMNFIALNLTDSVALPNTK